MQSIEITFHDMLRVVMDTNGDKTTQGESE